MIAPISLLLYLKTLETRFCVFTESTFISPSVVRASWARRLKSIPTSHKLLKRVFSFFTVKSVRERNNYQNTVFGFIGGRGAFSSTELLTVFMTVASVL